MTTIQKVTFPSRGLQLAANLFLLPVDEQLPDRKHAAVIVGHQGTRIKEQAPGLYAETLATAGYVALAFDAAHWGESEGIPRGLEDPSQSVEDFKCAVTFLSQLGDAVVDPSRIGVVGIRASGGYSVFAAATDIRIKAIAGISPMCNGRFTRAGLKDPATGIINRETLHQQLAYAANSRLQEAKGHPAPVHNTLDGRASVFSNPKEDIKGYYSSPLWSHPRCTNEMVIGSVELLVSFDAFQHIEWISPRPVLFVAGSEAVTLPFVKEAFQRAVEPKELVIMSGKYHVDLYQDVSETGPNLVSFFAESLSRAMTAFK
ncbi:Hydrolase_4 domain-containing protein [Fusarium acuminatum]|uniref:Hydrolase_4 domain-containing protein n=1 Tax=Fusarium acuminatum TaxID=5515 RepID=A0ABZ2XDX5_9HYPO